ncbi:transposase family protein [Streptomyces murinus]|uniref:transposase family protein n=1 Tax=Streptomyces murinus TaxID=33900 RepID=UPI0037F98960
MRIGSVHEILPWLAAIFGISTATAWRYVDETLEVLASRRLSSAWAKETLSSSTAP